MLVGNTKNPEYITVAQAVSLGFGSKYAIYRLVDEGRLRTSKYRGHTLCVNRADLEAVVGNPPDPESARKPAGFHGE